MAGFSLTPVELASDWSLMVLSATFNFLEDCPFAKLGQVFKAFC